MNAGSGFADAPEAPTRRDRPTPGADDARAAVRVERLGVAVIDDDAEIRALLRALLDRSERCTVLGEAGDGVEAIDLVREARPEIVLLDLNMPRLDGREALPKIVREHPESMVLVLSSLGAADEAERTFATGAFAYLEKTVVGPSLPHELAELYDDFRRALTGETVWASPDPLRVRR